MSQPEANQTLQIPEKLREQFQALERRLWRVDTVIAICGALSGLVVSYVLLFVSDRFWDTPSALRALFTLAGAGVSLVFIAGWLRQWIWRRRDYRALANLVQRHHRRLGDRLLGIVELADESKRPDNISPALCRAAIQQVSQEAVRFDFRQAVATRKPKIYFLAAVLLCGLVSVPWMLVPKASWNTLSRWLWPGSSVARFTFVGLGQLPSRLVVPHGEAFEILSKLTFESRWQPTFASCQFNDQAPLQAPVLNHTVLFRVPGQSKPGQLTLRVGDVTHRISVEPVFRPALARLTARVQYPDYLRYAPTNEVIRNGTFSFLEGSQVSFQGRTTRNLATAGVAMTGAEGVQPKPLGLTVSQEEFRSEPLRLEGFTQGAFRWRDELNLEAVAPWLLALQSRPDQAPEAECPDQAAVVGMLDDEVLEIKAGAQDDYGLSELGIAWECQKRSETNVAARAEVQVTAGSPQARSLAGNYRFSPALLHLPEDSIVTLRAVARDYFPGRNRSESSLHRIFILSREEHAKLVQQQFEKMLAEIEEATRREEALEEASRETKAAPAEKMASEETAKKLSEQAAEQNALAQKMSELSRKGAETLKEALRNKSIPTEMLKEWAEHLQTMESLSKKEMAQASQSLASAQSQQSPAARAAQLEKAIEQESEAVQKLQEMQKKMGSDLERMLANTLAQRLRKVGRTEKGVAESLEKVIPETIGLAADKLSQKHRDLARKLALGQEQTGRESHQLGEEISRFFDRTSLTNYGAVTREMKEAQVPEELSKTAEMIRRNVAAQAAHEIAGWAKRFNQWAEQLDAGAKSKKKEGSGESGDDPPSEEALERLLALLRAHQQEKGIRDQTQQLEEHKAENPSHREDSKLLSIRQNLLMGDVAELRESDPGKFLPKVQEAMGEADDLLNKIQTGSPTLAAETDAINLLEAEIMSMMNSDPSQSQASSEAMAMLMEMMGMGSGSGAKGGGNRSGGTTDKANADSSGDRRGSASAPRTVEKTSGRETRPLPVEFREALQNYYKAIERINP